MDFDGLKDKALGFVHDNKDKVEDGVEKAADFIQDKVDNDKVDAGVEKAKNVVTDNLDKL
ncbi:antitoxin [Jatrophihabitans telluris]|uniref:Antitoxin n=1 Tax=Jatrophihabitans telluris TaxID=2038343 RepID=A0ABY4QX28_9ACTN|nr:Rv0909 family putative TA system antitoxin [Jatrophihabitans telluris]UQX88075.1 antitoxin [Jatrophihabitans telluris]